MEKYVPEVRLHLLVEYDLEQYQTKIILRVKTCVIEMNEHKYRLKSFSRAILKDFLTQELFFQSRVNQQNEVQRFQDFFLSLWPCQHC